MITDKHDYDSGYISLVNIQLGNAPDKVLVNNSELLKKGEFHISIMAIKNLAPLLNSENIEQASEQLKQDFLDFVETQNLSNFTLTNEHRLVTRDGRITVVAMANLQDVDELFDYLRKKHDVDFPTQPTHITLYTLQPEAGIGILSQQELERDSVVVTIPELDTLKVVQQ